MAVGLPSGTAETLGEAATVVGDAAGSGANAAPLTVMVGVAGCLQEKFWSECERPRGTRGEGSVSTPAAVEVVQAALRGSLPKVPSLKCVLDLASATHQGDRHLSQPQHAQLPGPRTFLRLQPG